MTRITSAKAKVTWSRAAPFAFSAVIIGVVVVIMVSAAGTPIGFEAESGTLAAGATATTVTGQSGTGAVRFAAATPSPTPVGTLMGWQLTTQNIGLTPKGLDCASLPVYTGSYKPASGTTITEKRITFAMDLSNGNITIERSCIQPIASEAHNGDPILDARSWSNGSPAPVANTVRDSEFDATLLPHRSTVAYNPVGSSTKELNACWVGPFQGGINMYRNYIHGFGGGGTYTGTGDKLTLVYENNYATAMVGCAPADIGNHSSALSSQGFTDTGNPGRSLTIRGSRLNEDTSENATGGLFFQPYQEDIRNIFIEGNLVEGNGYNVVAQDGYGHTMTNAHATNNRFDGGEYGTPVYTPLFSQGWSTWNGNYMYNPNSTDGKGTAL